MAWITLESNNGPRYLINTHTITTIEGDDDTIEKIFTYDDQELGIALDTRKEVRLTGELGGNVPNGSSCTTLSLILFSPLSSIFVLYITCELWQDQRYNLHNSNRNALGALFTNGQRKCTLQAFFLTPLFYRSF